MAPISTETIVLPPVDVSTERRKPIEYRLYKRRWYILFLFFNSYAANNVQWVQYSSIANTIQSYYNVSSHAVNWATSVFYVGFIVCIIPATWLFKTQGLRRASLLGIFLTALGAWIKVFSAVPDRFYLTFIGQTVAAVGQTFIFGINSAVAAAWFGPKEVATADCIAALGSMLGAVISFLFSPMIVFSDPKVNEDETTYELKNLFYFSATYSTAVCILMIIYFPDKPPKSASAADALAEDVRRRTNYIKSMKSMLSKKNYLLLLLDYSLSLGVLGSLSALINPIILSKFPSLAPIMPARRCYRCRHQQKCRWHYRRRTIVSSQHPAGALLRSFPAPSPTSSPVELPVPGSAIAPPVTPSSVPGPTEAEKVESELDMENPEQLFLFYGDYDGYPLLETYY